MDMVFSHTLASLFSALAFWGWDLEVREGKNSPVAFLICLSSPGESSLCLWLRLTSLGFPLWGRCPDTWLLTGSCGGLLVGSKGTCICSLTFLAKQWACSLSALFLLPLFQHQWHQVHFWDKRQLPVPSLVDESIRFSDLINREGKEERKGGRKRPLCQCSDSSQRYLFSCPQASSLFHSDKGQKLV